MCDYWQLDLYLLDVYCYAWEGHSSCSNYHKHGDAGKHFAQETEQPFISQPARVKRLHHQKGVALRGKVA